MIQHGISNVRFLEPISRANVVHPVGDERLHGPFGDGFSPLVRKTERHVDFHEQRLGG